MQYYFIQCTDECNPSLLGHNDGKGLENSTSGMLGNVPISYPNMSVFYPNPYEKDGKLRVFDQRHSPFFVDI
jgi:hypothetical protein